MIKKTLDRRQLIVSSAIGTSLAAMSLPLQAQSYPNKPIKLVVPYAPGGMSDVLTRYLAKNLSQTLNQPVIIENRPGASGVIGASSVAKSPADGYTILSTSMSSLVLGSFFYPNNAPPLTALTPLGAFAFSPFVLVSSKFNSISEMTNKQIKFGNPSMGSMPHVLSVLMGKVAGFQAIHLPAKGSGPMIQEILNGQSDVAFAPIAAAKSLVASGRLRYLAATAKIDEIPEIPTFDQLGLGDAVINEWYGLFAPAGISLSLVSQLNKSLNMAVESKEQQQMFSNFGIVPQFSSPEQFSQLLTLYSLRLGKVINEESIKLEI